MLSFMTILTCFIYTLYHFYAFSGTNLLTRCRSASSCFLLFLVSEILHRKYSRNWTKQKPRILFSTEPSRSPKRKGKGAEGAPHHLAAPSRGGPGSFFMGWAPRDSPDSAPSPIYSLHRENPITESHDTRKVPETPPPPIPSRGIQEIASGTLPERGIITRRTIHHHDRLRTDA